jgi:hypothetical protein
VYSYILERITPPRKFRYKSKLHRRISTLEELEQALDEGRLSRVPGFGPKKLETVRRGLAEKLHGEKAQ